MQYNTGLDNSQAVSLGGLVAAPGDILVDVGRTGRVTPWHIHKTASEAVSTVLMLTHPDTAARMHNCANRLTFHRDWQDPDDAGRGRLHLAQAYFCRARLCPMCQWRRSLKMHGQVQAVVSKLIADRAAAGRAPYEYSLLTLTVLNCDAAQLSETLDQLQAGWQRLMRRKAVKDAVQGYVRAVEITYNRQTGQYHPHIHALLCVNHSYFNSRKYIPQCKWVDLWHDCARLDYYPQVDIRKAKGDAKGIAEVTKYATKPSDYIMPSDVDQMSAVLDTLMTSCTKRRFAGWGGVMADAHSALQLDDVEDGDLIHTGYDDAGESAAGAALWSWDWYSGPRLYIANEKGECHV
jgi:plasmid rolling circle replication initiator protein Rep